jgi:hypothetical protein
MGFYDKQILPRILNAAGGMKTLEPLRRRVCQDLAGNVVEIGFGSGLNILWVPKMPSPHTTCEYSWGSRTAAAGPAIRTAGRRSDRADEVTRPIIMPCG